MTNSGPMERLGRRLKELRQRKGLSLAAVGALIGVDARTQHRREGGDAFPVEELFKYGTAFGVAPASILSGVEHEGL